MLNEYTSQINYQTRFTDNDSPLWINCSIVYKFVDIEMQCK